jgi:transcriptional regulator with XRE-family HTH domain
MGIMTTIEIASRDEMALRIGQNIRRLRNAKGMSQKALGRMVGMSQVEIHYLETAKRRLEAPLMLELVAALDTTVENLLR